MMAVSDARQDNGYALLATLWLLLLAASVAGLLMMRSVQGSRAVAAERAALMRTTAEESALETAAADLLLNGGASRFGALPSTAVYRIAARDYSLEASRESDHIDINEAPLALIDSELRLASVNPIERARLIAMLDEARRSRRSFVSLADVAALAGNTPCLAGSLTPYQGRTTVFANSRGAVEDAGIGRPTAWRLRIAGPGARRAMIARPGLPGDQPLQVLEMPVLDAC